MLAALVVLAMASGDVLGLLEAEKYSEALRAGKAAVEAEPGSARAHHDYGVVLRTVLRRAEAVRELERAHQLAPDDPAIAVQLAWALSETRQLDRARQIAAGLTSDAGAAELIAWLERVQRIMAGPKTPHPPGSASAYVTEVVERLRAGRVEEFVRRDIDGAVLRRWARDVGVSPDDEFVSGVARGFGQAAAAHGTNLTLRGYEVGPEAAGQGGLTVVKVALLTESRSTREEIAMFEKALADPSAPLPMNPEVGAILRALEPADRKATLGSLAAESTFSDVTVDVEVTRGAAGAWKVVDIEEATSGLRMSQVAGVVRDLADRGAIDMPRRRDRAYEIGQAVGRLVGVLLVLALGVFLWRRSQARKRRS